MREGCFAMLLLGVTGRLHDPVLHIVNNYTEPQFSLSGLDSMWKIRSLI